MKIETTRPPKHVWEKAHSLFELNDARVVYTYGNTLHNPGGITIDRYLEAHESVHAVQQAAMGGPDKWWARYFTDPKFRYDQELHAYREQYSAFCDDEHDRNRQAKFLWEIATHLASKMYSAGISHAEAMQSIRA